MPSRSINVAANGNISFLFMASRTETFFINALLSEDSLCNRRFWEESEDECPGRKPGRVLVRGIKGLNCKGTKKTGKGSVNYK